MKIKCSICNNDFNFAGLRKTCSSRCDEIRIKNIISSNIKCIKIYKEYIDSLLKIYKVK